ncbi:ethanolamine utilization microcompartment protein EutL [Exilibacterium tricleocarpae]|uniref:Ethanolamine utilization microcompartment protein EutL n=1 Tax=Exilibacterium tricleocarpae TaxID=2591008 RepID=A0A545TV85_9GAMM|nr:ethanolamine utilization microcompartment protein EutL [Exilibacterium tricleocarpae]TQV81129.1 ethanolamine utilization microcompartment protein EutL [Exilibacterium tricleocarpae]
MAVLDDIKASVLATRVIAAVDPAMAEQFKLTKNQRCIGMLTADCDDVTYVALDEATKAADVEVVYGRSFYAGAAHASGPLSGEVIGVLAGPGPADVRAGLQRAREVIEHEACFKAANADGSLAFFAHLVSATGGYLSKEGNVPRGQALAYLIAPPLEAMFGMDAALKAANVEIAAFFAPPSETNFGGGYLTGSQAACKAACDAFQQAVLDVAAQPLDI